MYALTVTSSWTARTDMWKGLEVFIYWSQGQPQVGAKATGIHLVNPKA